MMSRRISWSVIWPTLGVIVAVIVGSAIVTTQVVTISHLRQQVRDYDVRYDELLDLYRDAVDPTPSAPASSPTSVSPASDEQVEAAVAAYCAARGECRGDPGTDGRDGAAGADGRPGASGADVSDEQVEAAVAAYCAGHECAGTAGPSCPDGYEMVLRWVHVSDGSASATEWSPYLLCEGA